MKRPRASTLRLISILLFASVLGFLPTLVSAQNADSPDNEKEKSTVAELKEENARLKAEVESLKKNLRTERRKHDLAEDAAEQVQAIESQIRALMQKFGENQPKFEAALRKFQAQVQDQIQSAAPDFEALQARLREMAEKFSREMQQAKKQDAKTPPADEDLKPDESTRADRERDLLREQAKLAEQELAIAKKKVAAGRASTGELRRAQRELLHAQRELAASEGDKPEVRETLRREIQVVQEQLEETRKQAQVGAASPEDEIPLQREILRLKRELLRLE